MQHPRCGVREAGETHHLQPFLNAQLLLLHEVADRVRHRVHDRNDHQDGEGETGLWGWIESKRVTTAGRTGEEGGRGTTGSVWQRRRWRESESINSVWPSPTTPHWNAGMDVACWCYILKLEVAVHHCNAAVTAAALLQQMMTTMSYYQEVQYRHALSPHPTQTGCRSYPHRPIQLHSPGGVERPEHQRSLKENWTTTHFMRHWEMLSASTRYTYLTQRFSRSHNEEPRTAQESSPLALRHATSRQVRSGQVRSGQVRSGHRLIRLPFPAKGLPLPLPRTTRLCLLVSWQHLRHAYIRHGKKASVTHLTPKPVLLVGRVGELRHPHLHLGRCRATARGTLADDPAVNELLHR